MTRMRMKVLATVLALTSLMLISLAARSQDKAQGTLTIGAGLLGGENLDPISGPTSSQLYLQLMYDPVIALDNKGQLSTKSGLVERWTSSSDAKVWTLYIRGGAKFHNGDPVSAEDVAFTMKRLGSDISRSGRKGFWKDNILALEAKDANTLVVRTTGTPLLPYLLSTGVGPDAYVVPKKYIERVGDKAFAAAPVGSGPYAFENQAIGDHITFKATAGHWRVGTPKYERVIFRLVRDDTARLSLLKTGRLDIGAVNGDMIDSMRGSGLDIVTDTNLEAGLALFPNNQWDSSLPVANTKVREALLISINREELADKVFRGLAQAARSVVNAGDIAYSQNIEHAPKFDPARARSLLKAAGYANGFEISFWLSPRPGWPNPRIIAEAIAGYWQAIGVNAKIITADYGAYRDRMVKRQLAGAIGGQLMLAQNWTVPFLNAVTGTKGVISVAEDQTNDTLLKAALDAANLETAKDAAHKAYRHIQEQYILLPIVWVSTSWAVQSKIGKWDVGMVPNGPSWEPLYIR